MGLLDNLAGEILGGNTHTNLMTEVLGMLNNSQSGGIQGLVQQFAGKGLGDIINSWVGTGANLPITPQQVQKALGSDTVQQLASKVGISPDQVTSHLSSVLPKLIDQLTPNGQLPQGDILSKGLGLLKGLAQ
jgi:uncharacterized protein YidB (DUF937 family)